MADEEQQNNPPPPPQGGGYEEEGYTPAAEPGAQEDDAFARDASGPAVAASANKNLILMLVGGALGVFLLYQIFSGGDEAVEPAPIEMADSEAGAPVAPAAEIPIPASPIQPPPLPPPPPIPEPEVAPLPPPPPITPDIDFAGDGPANEELQKRRGSEMLIVSGTKKDKEEEGDPNVTTAAERAVATKVGDLSSLVLQGKIIDAVLETALDTTLQGPLRAIVSRDVYAESGYDVLIPKGSRLIGTYNTDVVRGQGRVFIIWSRLIRPDGIDIQLNSQTVDRLGRAGMSGHVDDRYFEIFGGAILTSILGITMAGVADAILDPPESTTTQGSVGSTTTTGNSVNAAITEGVENIGQVSTRVVGGLLDARPSITVDQGTPLKVFVNRDLAFPADVTGQIRIIQ